MTYSTEILAEYIQHTSYEDLPESAIKKVKLCIRDAIACALGGATTGAAKILTLAIDDLSPGGNSTIIGVGRKTSPPFAAYVNAKLTNVLDFDDSLAGHPASTVIAPAIAIGEMAGSTGKEIITAYCLAYEIIGRVHAYLYPHGMKADTPGFAPYQTFGSVTVAGKLLGLTQKELVNALGLAGANAPIGSSWKAVQSDLGTTMDKGNNGTASLAGITAAMLARRGFEGPPDIFEGDHGFWRMYGSSECDFSKLTENLGKEYLSLRVEFKRYPACARLFSIIEAIKVIKQNPQFRLEDIELVTIKVPGGTFMPPWTNPQAPETMYAAEFSTPYSAALTLTGLPEPPGPHWYSEDKLKSPRIREIINKVKIEAMPPGSGRNPMPCKVEIRTRGNQYFEAEGLYKPLSEEGLEDKFKYLAGLVLSGEKVARLAQLFNGLENINNINEVVQLLY
jgi:2-methylcitrate dehydratase PrpD